MSVPVYETDFGGVIKRRAIEFEQDADAGPSATPATSDVPEPHLPGNSYRPNAAPTLIEIDAAGLPLRAYTAEQLTRLGL